MAVSVRRAVPADAEAAADVWLRSRHASVAVIPAPVHTDDDVRDWFTTVVLPSREVWLGEAEGLVIAVLVLDGDELDQLYVDPGWTGRGVGSELVRLAQQQRPDGLALWTFQTNLPARRFYERHGFIAVRWTDGASNEERAPDVRYVWGRHPEGAGHTTESSSGGLRPPSPGGPPSC
jgi:GNAT superfamily N-acetyltransferase